LANYGDGIEVYSYKQDINLSNNNYANIKQKKEARKAVIEGDLPVQREIRRQNDELKNNALREKQNVEGLQRQLPGTEDISTYINANINIHSDIEDNNRKNTNMIKTVSDKYVFNIQSYGDKFLHSNDNCIYLRIDE
jgi:hypothetical protein